MVKKSFREWMRSMEEEDNAIGDLAREMAQDPNFPDSGDLDALEEYFEGIPHPHQLMDVLRLAWKNYLSST